MVRLHIRNVVCWLAKILLWHAMMLCVPYGKVVMMRRRRWQALRLLTNLEFSTARIVASSSAVHAAIPPVLNCVIAAAAESASDLGPPLAHLADHLLDHDTFLGSNGLVIEIRLQILMVPLTALLRRACLDRRGDADPIVRAMKVDKMN